MKPMRAQTTNTKPQERTVGYEKNHAAIFEETREQLSLPQKKPSGRSNVGCLQRLALGETTNECRGYPWGQTKLVIGKQGRKHELEADYAATEVVREMVSPQLQRRLDQHEGIVQDKEQDLATKPITQHLPISPIRQPGIPNSEIMPLPLAAAIHSERAKGQALSDQVRQSMERAFGADFSQVMVHTNGCSHEFNRSLHARAFTTGQDIFFRQGGYEPGTGQGRELLAHELTHVVQQSHSDLEGTLIQLTPTDDFQNALTESDEDSRHSRLLQVIRMLDDSDLEEAETLYVRLTQQTRLRTRFEDLLPTYHADVLTALVRRLQRLRQERAERRGSRDPRRRQAISAALGGTSSLELSPQLLERIAWARGVRRVAGVAPPMARQEGVEATLEAQREELRRVSAQRARPEAGRVERQASLEAAQRAAERVPESERPSGRQATAAEFRAIRSEPEAGRAERQASLEAAQRAAERVPESERPSGRQAAATAFRIRRSETEQLPVAQPVLEAVMRQEERERRIGRGEIIWEDVPGIITENVATGLLAIAVIGFAVGAGIISGGTAAVFAGSIAASSWMSDYFQRRQEIEQGGYDVPIPATVIAALGDVLGVSRCIESITGERIHTGRQLTSEERTASVTGFSDLALLLVGSRAFRVAQQRGIRWRGSQRQTPPLSIPAETESITRVAPEDVIWEHLPLGEDETTGTLRFLSRHRPTGQFVRWQYNPATGEYYGHHLETGTIGITTRGEAGVRPPPAGLPPAPATATVEPYAARMPIPGSTQPVPSQIMPIRHRGSELPRPPSEELPVRRVLVPTPTGMLEEMLEGELPVRRVSGPVSSGMLEEMLEEASFAYRYPGIMEALEETRQRRPASQGAEPLIAPTPRRSLEAGEGVAVRPSSLEEINAAIDSLLVEGLSVTFPESSRFLQARQAFEAGNLFPEDMDILIEYSVGILRAFRLAERAPGRQGLLNWDDIVGQCEEGRDIPASSLEVLARNSRVPIDIRRYQTSQVFGNIPSIARHGFLIVTFRGVTPVPYLIDPTFGQFLRPGVTEREYTYFAESLRNEPARASFARELVEHGYVRLNSDNAAYFAEAMGIPREQILRQPGTYDDFEGWQALSAETIGAEGTQAAPQARLGPLITLESPPLPEGIDPDVLMEIVPEQSAIGLRDASELLTELLGRSRETPMEFERDLREFQRLINEILTELEE